MGKAKIAALLLPALLLYSSAAEAQRKKGEDNKDSRYEASWNALKLQGG